MWFKRCVLGTSYPCRSDDVVVLVVIELGCDRGWKCCVSKLKLGPATAESPLMHRHPAPGMCSSRAVEIGSVLVNLQTTFGHLNIWSSKVLSSHTTHIFNTVHIVSFEPEVSIPTRGYLIQAILLKTSPAIVALEILILVNVKRYSIRWQCPWGRNIIR